MNNAVSGVFAASRARMTLSRGPYQASAFLSCSHFRPSWGGEWVVADDTAQACELLLLLLAGGAARKRAVGRSVSRRRRGRGGFLSFRSGMSGEFEAQRASAGNGGKVKNTLTGWALLLDFR